VGFRSPETGATRPSYTKLLKLGPNVGLDRPRIDV